MTRMALVTIAVAICAGCSNSNSPTSPAAASTTGGGTPANFQGQYSGTYRVNSCAAEGIFVGFCEGSGSTAETTFPITLSLTQNQSAVTGSVMLGEIAGMFQGTASGSTLSGTAAMADISDQGLTLNTSITTWNTTLSGSGLSGGFNVVFRVTGSTGSATWTATIVQLTR
ncbi:MAG TPA: hypothetical protein VGJ39_06300 [Vicinamibacterales bacterium]